MVLARFSRAIAADTTTAVSMEIECICAYRREATYRLSTRRLCATRRDQLEYLVLLAHDVTETRAMTDQLEYQAHFDELTGLVNRRAFVERLDIVGADAALKDQRVSDVSGS